jgi:dihydroflavonol-4-reductase
MAVYFVTGGTGFLGGYLVRELASAGHAVWCLARREPHLLPCNTPVHWIRGELHDLSAYRPILERANYVLHLAGAVTARRREVFEKFNVEATRKLIAACREARGPLQRFVHVSSIAAMGPNRRGEPLRSSDPCAPTSEYGQSKLKGERVVLRAAASFPVTILRPSFIYGSGDQRGANLVRSLLRGQVSPWTSRILTISLCHVSDVVQACLKAAHVPLDSGQVLLVAEPRCYSWSEIIDTVSEVLSQNYPLLYSLAAPRLQELRDRFAGAVADSGRTSQAQFWGCDVILTERLLNWKAQTSLEAGARASISWYTGWSTENLGQERDRDIQPRERVR